MVASVSINDCNSTVRNTRFQLTRFVMYIQSHTWFPSALSIAICCTIDLTTLSHWEGARGSGIHSSGRWGANILSRSWSTSGQASIDCPRSTSGCSSCGPASSGSASTTSMLPHFHLTPPRSCFGVEFRMIVTFHHSIPQWWTVEHCCPSSVWCDCGIWWSTPAVPCRFFLPGLQVGVEVWQCGVLVVGQVPQTNS